VVARQLDVLVIHDPEDGSAAERLSGELSGAGLEVGSAPFEGDRSGLVPSDAEARAVVIVVGPAVAARLASPVDLAVPHGHLYFLVLPGPPPFDLARFPMARAFDIEGIGELARTIIRDLESDASSSSSSAPPDAPATSEVPLSKTAGLRSDEESGKSEPLDAIIFGSLDPSSRAVLAQAERLARLGGASRIHMDHLFVALYRQPDGPTQRFFAGERVTTDELARLVKGIPEPILIDPPAIVEDLDAPPAVSRHVGLALRLARETASIFAPADEADQSIATRDLLYGALSVSRCTLVRALRQGGRLDPNRIVGLGGGPSVEDSAAQIAQTGPGDAAVEVDAPIGLGAVIAGFASDDAKGRDLLDIRREVDALGKVIAARDVSPPLAVGLFGDWGTGKTFFMKRLQSRIRAIAQAEKDDRKPGEREVYCKEIVQLEFNAWTYIDDNLWASLASAIFDGLDASLTRRDKDPDALRKDPETLRTDEFKRAKVLTRKAAAQHTLEAAQQAKAAADRHLEATDARLRTLATGSPSPKEIVAGAWTVAMSDDATKKTADRATESIRQTASDLHLDPEVVTRELARSGDYRGRLTLAIRSLVVGWRWWLPVAILAALIIGVVAVVAPVVAPWLVGLGGLAVVSAIGYVAKPVWKLLGTARTQYLEIVERDRKALKIERTVALDRAAKAQGEVDAARNELLQADASLEDLRPSRQLANFVSARHTSADYRGRLGVVAQAREDFEQLAQLILKSGKDGQAGDTAFPPAVDRIILYIDDLDRCREKEVVDVLQAVHLLLAFQLFVVVVAVDPRWLVHSLRVQSRVLQGQGASRDGKEAIEEEAAEWQSTPLNYLEKIFQVPYAIRPMGEAGFKAMIHDLVGPTEPRPPGRRAGVDAAASREATSASSPVPGTEPDDVDTRSPDDGPRRVTDDPVADMEQPTPAGGSPVHQAAPADDYGDDQLPVQMEPDFLHISEDERIFMGWLHPLVQTPRAAKRFVNVYRILKSSVEPNRRAKLDMAAQHRAVLTLLAMLTSHPTQTTTLLQALVDDGPTTDWWSFFTSVRDDARTKEHDERRAAAIAARRPDPGPDLDDDDDWSTLSEKLAKVQARWPSAAVAPFVAWARDVSRFSFESSRVVLTPADEATREDGPVENAALVQA